MRYVETLVSKEHENQVPESTSLESFNSMNPKVSILPILQR